MKHLVIALSGLLLLICAPLTPAQNQLQKGDFVAICGDSITEQKLYSLFIQDYLMMCRPQGDVRTMQFGWGGETAGGFLNKMPSQALKFDMSVATTCYGMNDGGYSPMTPDKAKRYRDTMTGVVRAFKKKGVRFIVVGSPGVVDSDTFRPKDAGAAEMYNKTLNEEREIARDIAQKEGCAFADVYGAMMDAMVKAKAKYGAKYHVGGGDGVHPDRNGHLAMAYAFLKGLGVDGNIGTITVDIAGNKATATDGHRVVSVKDGAVEVESSRYPFCFYGDPKSTNATTGILEFLPFNQDLNRYTLVVTGAGAGDLKVTWGKTSRTFKAADLEKGINLAAEFMDNPFSEPFAAVERTFRQQQDYETPLIKTLMAGIGDLRRMVPEEGESFDRITARAMTRERELQAASAAAVKPVTHVIKVEAVK
jgi:lysophospholipase L1-like esterase